MSPSSLPLSMAEVIDGVSAEIERVAGRGGLLTAEIRCRRIRGDKKMSKLLATLDTDQAEPASSERAA